MAGCFDKSKPRLRKGKRGRKSFFRFLHQGLRPILPTLQRLSFLLVCFDKARWKKGGGRRREREGKGGLFCRLTNAPLFLWENESKGLTISCEIHHEGPPPILFVGLWDLWVRLAIARYKLLKHHFCALKKFFKNRRQNGQSHRQQQQQYPVIEPAAAATNSLGTSSGGTNN